MLENGTVINGRTVLYSVFVRGGRLVLAADERGYATGWMSPGAEAGPELLYPHFRQSGADVVTNFMTRYKDANGADVSAVLSEVREALGTWQKGAARS
jgi:hypothetical protein